MTYVWGYKSYTFGTILWDEKSAKAIADIARGFGPGKWSGVDGETEFKTEEGISAEGFYLDEDIYSNENGHGGHHHHHCHGAMIIFLVLGMCGMCKVCCYYKRKKYPNGMCCRRRNCGGE